MKLSALSFLYNEKQSRQNAIYFCFYAVGATHEVEVESGLVEGKALEILALYTGMRLEALPEEARTIATECKGM